MESRTLAPLFCRTTLTLTAQSMAPAPSTKPLIQDEGDGKHSILTLPGDPDPKEVTPLPGSKNAYIDESTGTKYVVMPDATVTKIPHATKKVAVSAKSS